MMVNLLFLSLVMCHHPSTQKLGAALKMKMAGKVSKKTHMKIGDWYASEFCLFKVHFLTLVAEHFIWN
jgi:hypothetical protein